MGFGLSAKCLVCDEGFRDLPFVGLVTVNCESGLWTFQTDILHYIQKHGWVPHSRFVREVMEVDVPVTRVKFGDRLTVQLAMRRQRVYYDGRKRRHQLPDGFIEHLERLAVPNGALVR
jgi:hypothetical protein